MIRWAEGGLQPAVASRPTTLSTCPDLEEEPTIRDSRPRSRPDAPGGIAAFLTFLLLGAATLLVAVTAVLGSLVGVVLGPASWLQALETSGAYERAPAAIADQLLTSFGTGARSGGLARLEPQDVEALVAAAAPPAWLREQAAVIVPPLVSGLAATGEVRGTVPLGPLKARLTGAPLQAAAIARVATWPACTAAQLQQLAGGVLQRCQPPPGFEGEIALAAGALFGAVAARLPDEIELASIVRGAARGPDIVGSPPGAAPAGGDGASPFRSIAAARPLVTSLVLVVVLLMAAATLVSGITFGALLRSVAIPLLGGGLLVLAAGWLARPVLETAADAARASVTAAGTATALASLGGEFGAAMVDQAHGHIMRSGVVLAVAGVLLLVVRSMVSRRT